MLYHFDTKEEASRVAVMDRKAKKERRRCLRCLKVFWSLGAGNRICAKCKRKQEQDVLRRRRVHGLDQVEPTWVWLEGNLEPDATDYRGEDFE